MDYLLLVKYARHRSHSSIAAKILAAYRLPNYRTSTERNQASFGTTSQVRHVPKSENYLLLLNIFYVDCLYTGYSRLYVI